MIILVPNELSAAIHAAIDKALNGRPCDEQSRDTLYRQLLEYYDIDGRLPEFELKEASE